MSASGDAVEAFERATGTAPGFDFNRTPRGAVLSLVAAVSWDEPASWLDLGAGDGNIAVVLAELFPRARGFAVERDAELAKRLRARLEPHPQVEVIRADYLTASLPSVTWALTNPPYEGDGPERAADRARELGHRAALLCWLQWWRSPRKVAGRRECLVEACEGVYDVGKLAFRGGSATATWSSAWLTWTRGAPARPPGSPVPTWIRTPFEGAGHPALIHARDPKDPARTRCGDGLDVRAVRVGDAPTCLGCLAAAPRKREQLSLAGLRQQPGE